jgi:hypothetical protein
VLDTYFANQHYGSQQLRSYINCQLYSETCTLKLHTFGHCHRDGGEKTELGGIVFSNAATYHNVIDF